MLNKSGDRSPCPRLNLTEKTLSFTVIYVNCSFLFVCFLDTLYQVEEVLYSSFAKSFYCEWVLDLSIFFQHWLICYGFSLLVCWFNKVRRFSNVDSNLCTWNKSYLAMVHTPFIYYWIKFADISLRMYLNSWEIKVHACVCVCVCVGGWVGYYLRVKKKKKTKKKRNGGWEGFSEELTFKLRPE